MTSEERDDNYWMGVRDALRMVDSFLRWARKHPKDAKSIDDFLAEGLIAAAKRCESCLGKELGMKYGSDDPEIDDPREIEEPTHFEEPIPEVEPDIEAAPITEGEEDVVTESDVSDEVIDEPEMPSAEPVSIDEIERPETVEASVSSKDLDFEDKKRDFLSDFPLIAPEPIVEESDDTGTMPSTPEEVMRAVLEEEALGPVEVEEEEVLPSEDEDAKPESYDDVLELLDSPLESVEESPPPAAIPKRELWSPYDEPPLPEDEIDEAVPSSEDAEDEPVSEESDTPATAKPPPPPPPPETDETEEERRKRARRLFFGT